MSDFIYSVNYKLRSSLYDDPENWNTEIVGNVYVIEHDNEVLVAKIRCYYVDLITAIKEGFSPSYILDLYSDTAPFIKPLFEQDGFQFKNNILKLLRYAGRSPSLFIFDRLEIIPEHRGKDLTEKLINEMTRLFSAQADVLALKPYPLQFENQYAEKKLTLWEQQLRLNDFGQDLEKARASLVAYYKTMGFKRVPGEEIMVKLKELNEGIIFD